MPTVTRYLCVSDEAGVYLGSCMGMGFWSKLDPVGQCAAITFPNQEEFDEYRRSVDDPRPFDSCRLVPVELPFGETAASVMECVRAGVPVWEVDAHDIVKFSREREERVKRAATRLN